MHFNLKLIIFCGLLFILYVYLPSIALAAQVWYDGSSSPQDAPCPTSGNFICNTGGTLSCGGTATTTDLRPCQLAGKNYSNSCNTSNWTLTYAKSCTGVASGFYGTCNIDYNYDSHTCSVGDSCVSGPYLNPGICDASRYSAGGNPDDACATSSTVYKTCCNSDGTVDGSCTGGNHTGSCGGATIVMCGVSSSTCAEYYGQIKCTTAPCGSDACSILKVVQPPPDPDPIDPGPGCACTYPENCTTPDSTTLNNGVQYCQGINETSAAGQTFCKWDDRPEGEATCATSCTGCQAGGGSTPGGNVGGGPSGNPGDMAIYVDPSPSLKGKNLVVTSTMSGCCKSDLRMYPDTRDDNGNILSNLRNRDYSNSGFSNRECILKGIHPKGDGSTNPKDNREAWAQWECPAKNEGGCFEWRDDDGRLVCDKEKAKWTVGTETSTQFCAEDVECFNEKPYFINPSARIVGRFFYDSNGDGLHQNLEQFIKKPGSTCSGYSKSDILINISGPDTSNRYPEFCDSIGPYFDSGIIGQGNYTVTAYADNGSWKFTTPCSSSTYPCVQTANNLSGRKEYLFGVRYPPCTNTIGTNQLIGCMFDGVNFDLPGGNAPNGKEFLPLSSPVPDSFSLSDPSLWPLEYDWRDGQPNSFVGADTFSAIWKGNFNFKTNGTYTFYTGADDGIMLKVDDSVIRNDLTARAPYSESAPYRFVGSSPHPVELKYNEDTENARVSLKWVFTPDSNAWIQTIGGDVHSNGRINISGGPP